MAKRRARTAAELRRKAPEREPYDVVLIVCEGERTEVEYLRGLRRARLLSSANIEVVGRGTDPVSVVRFALEKARKDGVYDRVYCVFDRDRHANFAQALDELRRARVKGATLHSGITNPCFEFWVLLHFDYTSRGYAGAGRRSPCDMVIEDLRRHLSGYAKNDRHLFEKLDARVPDAIRHATRLAEENRRNGSDNPSTNVHELVAYLMRLRAERLPVAQR